MNIYIYSAADFATTRIRVEREAGAVLVGYVDCFICTPKTQRSYKTKRVGDDSWQLTNLTKHFDVHFGQSGQSRKKRVLPASLHEDPLADDGDSSFDEPREKRAAINLSSSSIESLVEPDPAPARSTRTILDIEPVLELHNAERGSEPAYEALDADTDSYGDAIRPTSADHDLVDDQDNTTNTNDSICESTLLI